MYFFNMHFNVWTPGKDPLTVSRFSPYMKCDVNNENNKYYYIMQFSLVVIWHAIHLSYTVTSKYTQHMLRIFNFTSVVFICKNKRGVLGKAMYVITSCERLNSCQSASCNHHRMYTPYTCVVGTFDTQRLKTQWCIHT